MVLLNHWNIEELAKFKKAILANFKLIAEVLVIQFDRDKPLDLESYFYLVFTASQVKRIKQFVEEDSDESNVIIDTIKNLIRKAGLDKDAVSEPIKGINRLRECLKVLAIHPMDELFTVESKKIFLETMVKTYEDRMFETEKIMAISLVDYLKANESFIEKHNLDLSVNNIAKDAFIEFFEGDTTILKMFRNH